MPPLLCTVFCVPDATLKHVEIVGIGAAPVSFGVFGEPSHEASWGRDAEAVLAAIASAGYLGTELGAPRFFGPPEKLRSLLDDHGLQMIGAYIPLHLGDPTHRAEDLRSMRLTLEELATGERPLAILADWGSAALMANPARGWDNRALALDEEAWRHAEVTLRHAIKLATDFGVDTTYHPHISTYVESRWEIERLLDTVDISLTIDTGHLFLAGMSPTDALRAWPDRVNHIHLKDVHAAVLRDAKARNRVDFEAWWAHVSCPLGEGDVGLDDFIDTVREVGYRGWLVVEQDRAMARADEFEAIVRDQTKNQAWVRERLAVGDTESADTAAGRATSA